MDTNEIHPDVKKLIGKNLLFIDLETTGFPGKVNVPDGGSRVYEDLKKYGKSRIIQIGYQYYENFSSDFEVKLDDIKSLIIKPSKPRKYSLGHSFKVHGISYDKINNDGRLLTKVLNEDFGKCLVNCDYVISYNTAFDIPILASELFRIGFKKKYNALLSLIDDDKVFCMKKLSSEIFKKSIKQKDAYLRCYGKEPIDQHDAKGDVYAMLMILKYIIDNKILEMPNDYLNNIIESRNGSPWTKAEENKLIDEYKNQGLGATNISDIHKRTVGSIAARLSKLDIIDDRKNVQLDDISIDNDLMITMSDNDNMITISKKEYNELLNYKNMYITAIGEYNDRQKISSKRIVKIKKKMN